MQELEKILEEIEIKIAGSMGKKREGLLEAHDIIRKHMNDGWIPVEERLPEVDVDIAETFEDDDCPEYNVTIRGASESTTLKYSPDGTWFDQNGYVYDVIAWRPMPEAYRQESKTEQSDWRADMLSKFDRRSRQ